MRLLYIHGNALDSQAANVVQVLNMCQAFARCGAEVTLAIAAPRKREAEANKIAASHLGQEPTFRIVTFRKHAIAGRFNMLGSYFGARAALRKVTADLCFVRSPMCLSLSVAAGIPTVFEAHDSQLHRSPGLARFWEKTVLAKAADKRLISFVAISRALAQCWCEKGVPADKVIALHDGFSLDQFDRNRSQCGSRIRVGLPLGDKIIVYTGSLYSNRGIERILWLAKEFPEARFVVVGGPEECKRELESLAADQGIENTVWVGAVPHVKVADYLYAADVLLMLWTWRVPTIAYCSPLKLFEYMAAGRPIVGEAFPTIVEVVSDGDTAYLAPPDSFDDLVEKMRQALEQETPSPLAVKARELALREYSWTDRARTILNNVKGRV
jgi:glycosyltransferase involved in cell wall biosynthesis